MKNIKGAFNNFISNYKSGKIDRKKVNFAVGGCIVLVLLLCLILPNLFGNNTYNIQRVKNWAFSFQYNLDSASQDCMKHIKWKDRNGTVTLSGRDKKTNDKIIFTFKVGKYMSFESMTRNGKQLDKSDWDAYFADYKK